MDLENLYKKIKKNAVKTTFAGLVGLTLSGCLMDRSWHPEYYFEGKIGKDSLIYSEWQSSGLDFEEFMISGNLIWRVNNLIRITPEGLYIYYSDSEDNDLKIEMIQMLTPNPKYEFENYIYKTFTSDNDVGKGVLERGQKDFERYLKKILEAKERTESDSLQ